MFALKFTSFRRILMGLGVFILMQSSIGQAGYQSLFFSLEDPEWIGNAFVLDFEVNNTIDLKFGDSLTAYIRFDRLLDKLVLNRDIRMMGNELQNFRAENVNSTPTCSGVEAGKIIFLDTDRNFYTCNGTLWKQLLQ